MNLHIPSVYHPPDMPSVAPGHFWRTSQLGIRRPMWHCWCGTTIVLDYRERGYSEQRLYDFCDAHVDCVPPDRPIDEEETPA